MLFDVMRAPAADDAPVWAHLKRIEPDDDGDAQIALWTMYELAYRGFDDAPEDLEWCPPLLAVRRRLEQTFEATLRQRFRPPVTLAAVDGDAVSAPDFAERLFAYIADHEGASLSGAIQRTANRDQVLGLLRVRSLYHLKEADPTSWTVPRLEPEVKAALMAVQYDEYGRGDPNQLHAHLFARGMAACDLDNRYGAYVDEVPASVLAQNNAMTLFGVHRRLRASALGHFAAFETTSSLPSRRIAQGLRRLGLPQHMVDYYDEHVEADAVHDQLAVREICAPLVADEPHLAEDVLFGAFTCLDLESRFAAEQLEAWTAAA